jgi:hypothetical protein
MGNKGVCGFIGKAPIAARKGTGNILFNKLFDKGNEKNDQGFGRRQKLPRKHMFI